MLEKKDEIGLHEDGLVDADLIPLINTAWKSSFAWIDKNQNAFADSRGNPLNQSLLQNDDHRAALTRRKKSTQYNISNDTIITPPKISITAILSIPVV